MEAEAVVGRMKSCDLTGTGIYSHRINEDHPNPVEPTHQRVGIDHSS